mgnify:CR=1 FL=1
MEQGIIGIPGSPSFLGTPSLKAGPAHRPGQRGDRPGPLGGRGPNPRSSILYNKAQAHHVASTHGLKESIASLATLLQRSIDLLRSRLQFPRPLGSSPNFPIPKNSAVAPVHFQIQGAAPCIH